MNKHLWKAIVAIVVLAVCLAIPAAAAGADTFQIAVDGYQDYDEANEILSYVNAYRAEAGAAPLKIEPALTELAMQRAAEVAVYYSHTRPNDTSCGTVLAGTIFEGHSYGENIAIYFENAKQVCAAWKNSAGHYANMVHTAFKSIGIGCFYQEDGTRCWVQLFSDVVTGNTSSKTGVSAVEDVAVEVSSKYVSPALSSAYDNGKVTLYAGQKHTLRLTSVNAGWRSKITDLADCYTLRSSNSAVVKVDGTSLVGVSRGKATVYVSFGSKQISVPVVVNAKPSLSYCTNSAQQTVITWDDPAGKAILFYKEIHNDIWNCAVSGGSYNMEKLSDSDIYCFVLRVYDGASYVDVSDQLIIGNTSTLTLKITDQPSSRVTKAGKTAKFAVKADGYGLTYQWQYRTSSSGSWTNTKATGNQTNTLSISATAKKSGYQYRCQIKDAAGHTVYSNVATLYALGIKTQPVSRTAVAGKTAAFTVSATGYKISYQWQYRTSSSGSWKNVSASSGKTAAYSLTAAVKYNGYQYRCRITDGKSNNIYTDTVTLYVLGIKTQPVSKTAVAGQTVKFTVSAVGKDLSYQWQYRTSSSGSWKNASASSGKTKAYSVTTAAKHHGYQYRCRITDSSGNKVYTKAVTLYVLGIKTQPTSKSVNVGATAKFTVSAVGKGLTYQWQYRTSSSGSWKNVSASSGKTAAYSLTAASRHNGYQYRCRITDSAGNVLYSNVAKLTVKK